MTVRVAPEKNQKQKAAAERVFSVFLLGSLVGGRANDTFLYWILVLAGIAVIVAALGFLETRRKRLAGESKRRHAVIFVERVLPINGRRKR